MASGFERKKAVRRQKKQTEKHFLRPCKHVATQALGKTLLFGQEMAPTSLYKRDTNTKFNTTFRIEKQINETKPKRKRIEGRREEGRKERKRS